MRECGTKLISVLLQEDQQGGPISHTGNSKEPTVCNWLTLPDRVAYPNQEGIRSSVASEATQFHIGRAMIVRHDRDRYVAYVGEWRVQLTCRKRGVSSVM